MPSVEKSLEHEDGKVTPKVLSLAAKHRTDLEKNKEAELEVRPLVPCSPVRNGLLQCAIASDFEGLIHHRGQVLFQYRGAV